MLFLSRSAHAGHYSVSYSGGNMSTTGYSGSHTASYALNGNGFWGASGTGGWYAPYYPSGSASGSGAITTTLTWVPDYTQEPPPDSVFIAEEAHADWSASSSGYSSVSCDNGVGSTPTQSGLSGGSDGFRYSVQQNPGSSFSVNCSPSVSITGGTGSAYGIATVSYRVSTIIPTIGIAGTTQVNAQPSVLVGQKLVAQLSLGNATQSGWQWSISGADPFAGFQYTGSTGHALELTAAMKQQATLTWYHRYIGNNAGSVPATISCTCTITDPNGQQHQASASTKIQVYSPQWSFTNIPGTAGLFRDNQGNPVLGIYNAATKVGIKFTGQVKTPLAFLTGEERGMWGLARIITPQVSYTDNEGKKHTSPTNGQTGLDGQFTYAGLTFPDDNSPGTTNDTPFFSLTQSMAFADFSGTFKTYMLYRPPDFDGATGTTWVPMHEVDWNFSSSALVNPNTGAWQLSNASTSGVTVTLDTDTGTLPSWAQVITPVDF